MSAKALTCERDGRVTQLTCVECGRPICPSCLVRTEVGLKCASCAEPAAVRLPRAPVWRRPSTLLLAGVVVVLVAVGLAVVKPSTDDAPAPQKPIGTWSQQGFLDQNQGTATATVLPSGQVLVAGGGIGSKVSAAASLFDPAKNQWKPTGSMAQARRGHQAAALRDGRVLVAGGIADGKELASAELFDPTTDTWAPTAAMQVPRLGYTLTALIDGRALAVGGTATGTSLAGADPIKPEASAEIYDPATGAWTAAAPMSVGRFEHTATRLADGRVLVTGGLGPAKAIAPRSPAFDPGTQPAAPPLSSTELFEPSINGFVRAADMASARTNHAAVLLLDGSVLVAGGASGAEADQSLATTERFDAGRGSWAGAPSLTQSRTGESATVLDTGAVLVVGGEVLAGVSRRAMPTAEIVDPANQSTRSAGAMRCPRSEQAAVLIGDGTVLVVGGDAVVPGQPPKPQGCVERYHP